MGGKYTAVLAVISEGCGVEYIELYDKAVDEEMFLEFLPKLAKMNKGKKIAIVMDNLRVHKTDDVKDLMLQLKIEWIYNVPYSPDYNAIEFVFSQVKKSFKDLKL